MKIVTKDEVIIDYKLLNILSKESVINKSESEHSVIPDTDKIMMFSHCVYNPMDSHLVREKDYMSHILVGEELAQVLLKNTKGIELQLMI